jgi:hypothetical protein
MTVIDRTATKVAMFSKVCPTIAYIVAKPDLDVEIRTQLPI